MLPRAEGQTSNMLGHSRWNLLQKKAAATLGMQEDVGPTCAYIVSSNRCLSKGNCTVQVDSCSNMKAGLGYPKGGTWARWKKTCKENCHIQCMSVFNSCACPVSCNEAAASCIHLQKLFMSWPSANLHCSTSEGVNHIRNPFAKQWQRDVHLNQADSSLFSKLLMGSL